MKNDSVKEINSRLAELFNLPPTWMRGAIEFEFNRPPVVKVEFIGVPTDMQPQQPK